MGKRLTQEEREARIKAYEEAKAAKQAARLEKKKAREEAIKKRKQEKLDKGGLKPNVSVSPRVREIREYPPFKGSIKEGDELVFRWLSMMMAGTLLEIRKVPNFRGGTEESVSYQTLYAIKEPSDGTVYSVRRNDILGKKVNGNWTDEHFE